MPIDRIDREKRWFKLRWRIGRMNYCDDRLCSIVVNE